MLSIVYRLCNCSIETEFPVVAKLSSVHKGFGRFRCQAEEVFTDLASIGKPHESRLVQHRLMMMGSDAFCSQLCASDGLSVASFAVSLSSEYFTTEEMLEDVQAEVYILQVCRLLLAILHVALLVTLLS